MKCPKCQTEKACILFSSVLCVNKDCPNYDKSWADENKDDDPATPNFGDYVFYLEDAYTTTTSGSGTTVFITSASTGWTWTF